MTGLPTLRAWARLSPLVATSKGEHSERRPHVGISNTLRLRARSERETAHTNDARQGPQATPGRCCQASLVQARDLRNPNARLDPPGDAPGYPWRRSRDQVRGLLGGRRIGRTPSTSSSTCRTRRRSSRRWKSAGRCAGRVGSASAVAVPAARTTGAARTSWHRARKSSSTPG